MMPCPFPFKDQTYETVVREGVDKMEKKRDASWNSQEKIPAYNVQVIVNWMHLHQFILSDSLLLWELSQKDKAHHFPIKLIFQDYFTRWKMALSYHYKKLSQNTKISGKSAPRGLHSASNDVLSIPHISQPFMSSTSKL